MKAHAAATGEADDSTVREWLGMLASFSRPQESATAAKESTGDREKGVNELKYLSTGNWGDEVRASSRVTRETIFQGICSLEDDLDDPGIGEDWSLSTCGTVIVLCSAERVGGPLL